MIVERNDFASRGAEGLKQVRALHVPEFEESDSPGKEVQSVEREAANSEKEPESSEPESVKGDKEQTHGRYARK